MSIKGYILNVLIGLDHFGNTIIGGSPDETISARAGRAAEDGKMWGRMMSAVLNRIQHNHVEGAIEHDKQRAKQTVNVEQHAEDNPNYPSAGN